MRFEDFRSSLLQAAHTLLQRLESHPTERVQRKHRSQQSKHKYRAQARPLSVPPLWSSRYQKRPALPYEKFRLRLSFLILLQPARCYTAEGLQIPIANGGSDSKYWWSQSLTETSIHVPLKPGITAKDLDVSISPLSLCIASSGPVSADNGAPMLLVEGRFPFPVKASEAVWCVDLDPATAAQRPDYRTKDCCTLLTYCRWTPTLSPAPRCLLHWRKSRRRGGALRLQAGRR